MVAIREGLKQRHIEEFERALDALMGEDSAGVFDGRAITATARGHMVRAAVAAGWLDCECNHSGDIYTIDGMDVSEMPADEIIPLGRDVFGQYTRYLTVSKKKS